jgi:PhzF family phenazine biosynthesis protein
VNTQEVEGMKYYVVDAFADQIFKGNPAGICLLEKPIDVYMMQNIAYENNLPETAFLLKQGQYYDLRWFTPSVEVDLCGHATLASAFVLMNIVDRNMNKAEFHTKSGVLYVERDSDIYTLDFPSRKPTPCNKPDILEAALGVPVLETHISRDLVALVDKESTVADIKPDFSLLRKIKDSFAVVVTAKGEQCDFVSRFFAPNEGIDEDPVTGSSHSTLIPFWSERLNKTEMVAKQLSERGGTLFCKDVGNRVKIGGKAVCYLKGEIILPAEE